MNEIIWIHVASGMIALAAGTMAAVVRKGGARHGSAGNWFCASMLVLGLSASLLEPTRTPPGSPIGGIMVCYFVATAWVTARRRDGKAGAFEKIACAGALALGAAMVWDGFTGVGTPVGTGPVFILAAICLFAGLMDLNFILRGRLTGGQRISRHVWRICLAFFIATGSFFLGQQDVMPSAMRGSPILFVLAFTPFAVMLFWLVRLRFARMVKRLNLRVPATPISPSKLS
jgi:hypothetical protein